MNVFLIDFIFVSMLVGFAAIMLSGWIISKAKISFGKVSIYLWHIMKWLALFLFSACLLFGPLSCAEHCLGNDVHYHPMWEYKDTVMICKSNGEIWKTYTGKLISRDSNGSVCKFIIDNTKGERITVKSNRLEKIYIIDN